MSLPVLAPADSSLTMLFIGSAALGGGLLVAQLAAGLLGLGGEAGDLAGADGADGGTGEHGAMGWFSLRALAAFGLLFGLVGWGGAEAGWPSLLCIFLGLLAGVSIMAAVLGIARWQSKLTTSGTAQPAEAVGQEAEVYLRVPARGEGSGKISVELGGRWLQFAAVSQGPACPTGSRVRILALESAGVFLVDRSAVNQAKYSPSGDPNPKSTS
jgi:hypothetical protein